MCMEGQDPGYQKASPQTKNPRSGSLFELASQPPFLPAAATVTTDNKFQETDANHRKREALDLVSHTPLFLLAASGTSDYKQQVADSKPNFKDRVSQLMGDSRVRDSDCK